MWEPWPEGTEFFGYPPLDSESHNEDLTKNVHPLEGCTMELPLDLFQSRNWNENTCY